MNIKKLNETISRALREEGKTYYLYAGYHEIYLTDHKLQPPYMYQAENTDLNQLINDNISDIDEKGNMIDPDAAFSTDDSIIFDKSIMWEINKTDLFSGVIERMDDENDEEELRQNSVMDLSKYWDNTNESYTSVKVVKKSLKEEHIITKDEEENNRFVKLYLKCKAYKAEHPEMDNYEIAYKLVFNANEGWVNKDDIAKTWADMLVFDGAKDENLIYTVRQDILDMIEEYLTDDESDGDFENETEFEESLQKKTLKETSDSVAYKSNLQRQKNRADIEQALRELSNKRKKEIDRIENAILLTDKEKEEEIDKIDAEYVKERDALKAELEKATLKLSKNFDLNINRTLRLNKKVLDDLKKDK